MNGFYIKKVENAEDLLIPKIQTEGSVGMDLYANVFEETIIKPSESKLIKTGIMIEIPNGYEAQVRPRSGLALKNSITVLNSPGTIDSDYRGEIGVILINHGKEDFIINRADRIAQMVINKVEIVLFDEVLELSDTDRAEGGFGSSGVKENANTSNFSANLSDEIKINDEIFNDIESFSDNLSISKVVKFFEMKNIVFTKTMIQNYNRIGILPELINNRYYGREHLVYLYYIDLLKNNFSLEDIKNTLDLLAIDNNMIDIYNKMLKFNNDLNLYRNEYLSKIDDISKNENEKELIKMIEFNSIKNSIDM